MSSITLKNISKDLYRQIVEEAAAQGKSMEQLILMIISEYLEMKKRERQ